MCDAYIVSVSVALIHERRGGAGAASNQSVKTKETSVTWKLESRRQVVDDSERKLTIMKEEDRMKINACVKKLVPAINWREMWPKLLEHGIYRAEDKNVERWEANLDSIDNNRDIYLKIKTRGPKAFDSFVRCLKEIDRKDLANILKPEVDTDQVDNEIDCAIPEVRNGNSVTVVTTETTEDEYYESDNYYTQLQRSEEPLRVRVKKSNQSVNVHKDKVPCYMMTSNPRGLVLIINNIVFRGPEAERRAAEHDEKNLNDLFDQMGFDVEICKNLSAEEMREAIKKFSRRSDLRRVHSMFVVIMSHGDEYVLEHRSETIVCGVDSKSITDKEILNNFTATNCENMCKKPKVFIFQTCRGDRGQRAVNVSNVGISRHTTDTNIMAEPSSCALPTNCRDFSDMLVAYSTLPGHKAHRDNFTGSWYIQALCEVMMNHAHDTELTRLFQMADERLASLHTYTNECQTSVVTNYGFNKQCYLNPGYFKTSTDTH